MVLAGRTKLNVSKNFFRRGYLFVFVEYLCNRSTKIKTKSIKNYSSILAIVNHRNWLDDSPPLSFFAKKNFSLLKNSDLIFLSYGAKNPHLHTTTTILDKSFPKKIFCKGVQLSFEISLLSFIHKIFEQNFDLYITVYLARIWTYKNADEKAHTFSRRSKNVKKRTKTYKKRILCKFTFTETLWHRRSQDF